jgi:quercetin dioxygenase-like cupin family protein
LTHDSPHEVYQDLALSYALGSLEPEERRSFEEHLSHGCADCEAEFQSFSLLVGSLALTAEAIVPPVALRARLMGALGHSTGFKLQPSEVRSLNILRTGALPWVETRVGVWAKSLLVDAARRRATRLIRMEPGASISSHRHRQDEESFVLEGSGDFGGVFFQAGDYHRAPAGTVHPAYSSKQGCVFLLFSGTDHEFFAENRAQAIPSQSLTVGSKTQDWQLLQQNLFVKSLFSTPALSLATALLRVERGAAVGALAEIGAREVFVLEGDAQLESQELLPGDYIVEPAGRALSGLKTESSCLLLLHSYPDA